MSCSSDCPQCGGWGDCAESRRRDYNKLWLRDEQLAWLKKELKARGFVVTMRGHNKKKWSLEPITKEIEK